MKCKNQEFGKPFYAPKIGANEQARSVLREQNSLSAFVMVENRPFWGCEAYPHLPNQKCHDRDGWCCLALSPPVEAPKQQTILMRVSVCSPVSTLLNLRAFVSLALLRRPTTMSYIRTYDVVYPMSGILTEHHALPILLTQ